ncbi:hypothetical protein [Inhella sp.]|uniref:hypothetical protein n=1 Tax=Inhella sp. TaxID=1921806 RepID=UPI0035B30402
MTLVGALSWMRLARLMKVAQVLAELDQRTGLLKARRWGRLAEVMQPAMSVGLDMGSNQQAQNVAAMRRSAALALPLSQAVGCIAASGKRLGDRWAAADRLVSG